MLKRTAEGLSGSTVWRAAFSATLTMSMGISPFAIFALSALSPMVVKELGFSRTGLGSVATVAFAVAALSSVAGGRQVDLLGGRAMLSWVFITGGAAAVVMALAPTLVWLWAAGVLIGIGQGVANPVTNKLIAQHTPPGQQGWQIGVKQSGVPMIQALVGFTLPAIAMAVGWRTSMLMGVLLAVIGLSATWMVISSSTPAAAGRSGALKSSADSTVWWLTLLAFIVALTTPTVPLYAPLYAFERVGLAPVAAGMTTGFVGAAGIAGRILWGRGAERWAEPAAALLTIAWMAFVSLILLLLGEHLGAWALWAGLLGFGLSALAANAVVMLAVIRHAGASTGRASGLVGIGLFLGFMLGPIAFGALVDTTDSYTLGWGMLSLLSLVALGIAAVWRRGAGGR